MSYSIVELNPDGVETQFAFTKEYVSTDSIYGSIDGTLVNVTHVADNVFEFGSAPAVDSDARLLRNTDKTVMENIIPAQGYVRATHFNENMTQLLYSVQESIDSIDVNQEVTEDLINIVDEIRQATQVIYENTVEVFDDTVVVLEDTVGIYNDTVGVHDETVVIKDETNTIKDGASDEADRASYEADRAEAAANVAGAQVGEVKWYFTDHTAPIDRHGMVLPFGQLLQKEGNHANLWQSVATGQQPIVTETEWQAGQSACYVDYDEDQFRVPLINGQFIRTPGSLDPEFETRLPGATQLDTVGPVMASATSSEEVETTNGVIAETETRPVNVYMQPYIVYSSTTDGVGIALRGVWDASANILGGDALNSTLTKSVAPIVEDGRSPNGMGYVVVQAGDFDLTNEVGEESYAVGDRIVWVEGGISDIIGSWVQLKLSEVNTVNGEAGDVIVSGDTAPAQASVPLGDTILTYIDKAILAKEEAQYFVGKVVFEMDGIDPNAIYPGTWTRLTYDSQLAFGDGTVCSNTPTGNNNPGVPVVQHSHTATFNGAALPAHNHAQQAHTHGSAIANYGGGTAGLQTDTNSRGTTPNVGSTTAVNVAASAGTPTGTVSVANTGAAGATIDVRGSRIYINAWRRTA